MKNLFALFAILICYYASAQLPQKDILKFKVKKITIADSATGNDKLEYYYDEKGNDTSFYYDGRLQQVKKYEYDNKNRIIKITHYTTEGESETTIYAYKPDGSFSSVNKDKQFGLVNKESYDKTGKLLKLVIPDGSEHIYTYNAKGQLIKVHAVPKNGGVKKTTIYTYNAKGQLITEKTTGDYPTDIKYIYDSKGLVSKSINTTSMDGENQTTTSLYTYEFI